MGDRWVYFVVDIADYFLQPIYFGVKSVEFKIGAELDILNRIMSGLRTFKKFKSFRNGDWLPPISRVLVHLASLFGTSRGGVIVEVSGQDHGKDRNICLSVFAAEHGEVIPAVLPSLATQMILQGEITHRGIVPLPDWLPRERFMAELTKRHLTMAVRTKGSDSWLT
jgi:hypothetical protein